MNALIKAVRTAGSQKALARAIGVKQQNVHYWLKKKYPPGEYVLPIERATGVPRYELRPDLYPPNEFHFDRGKSC
jgi:DNA-binding transcriptional regulator YdaS (Cro superfamily)